MTKHTSSTDEVKPGIYRHYKNKDYKVIGCARHTETEEEFVVYQALYGERGLWIRPKPMFTELVEVEGKKIPRFRYLAESEESEADAASD